MPMPSSPQWNARARSRPHPAQEQSAPATCLRHASLQRAALIESFLQVQGVPVYRNALRKADLPHYDAHRILPPLATVIWKQALVI